MNRVERKIAFHNTNVLAYVVYASYARLLRVQSSGLSEKELAFAHKRVVAFKQAIDELSALRNHIYRKDNGIARKSQ
jgi:hypothetical protein